MQEQNRSPKRERGQAIILVALMALALVAFVGLALDGAHTYQQRRQMQNAADSGAYVGARELYAYIQGQGSPTLIASKIASYTLGNSVIGNGASNYVATFGTSPSSIDHSTPTTNDKCAHVNTVVTYSTYFIGLIGFDSLDAAAQATACWGPVVAGGGALWPMIIHTPTVTNPLVYGQEVIIWNDGTTQSGGFGWADFDGPPNGCGSNCELINWLTNSYAGPYWVSNWLGSICDTQANGYNVPLVRVGDCMSGSSGLSPNNGIQQAIQDKIDAGISVTVLMYNGSFYSGSNAEYHVVGLGRFLPTGECMNGNCCNSDPNAPANCAPSTYKWIKGKFYKWVGAGQICITNCYQSFGVDGFTLSN